MTPRLDKHHARRSDSRLPSILLMTGLCNLMWSATLRAIYCESRQYSPITMPLVMGRLPSLQSFSIGPLAVQAPQFRPSIFPFNYLLCVCSFMIDPWYAIKDVIHWILPIRVLHAVVFADVFCCSLFVETRREWYHCMIVLIRIHCAIFLGWCLTTNFFCSSCTVPMYFQVSRNAAKRTVPIWR